MSLVETIVMNLAGIWASRTQTPLLRVNKLLCSVDAGGVNLTSCAAVLSVLLWKNHRVLPQCFSAHSFQTQFPQPVSDDKCMTATLMATWLNNRLSCPLTPIKITERLHGWLAGAAS